MRKAPGFTLLELMVVIAVIAILASLAIPALLKSQRSSHETNAAVSLRGLSRAEVDFRGNDRDQNRVLDYWTRDSSGLHCVCPVSSTEPVRLTEVTLSGADSNPQGTAATPTAGTETSNDFFSIRAPKSGYWYLALPTDETGTAFAQATGGTGGTYDQAYFNHSRYAFMAYPESLNVGRYIYYMGETNTVFRRPVVSSVRPATGTPPGAALIQAGVVGAAPITQWPTDDQLKSDYSKVD